MLAIVQPAITAMIAQPKNGWAKYRKLTATRTAAYASAVMRKTASARQSGTSKVCGPDQSATPATLRATGARRGPCTADSASHAAVRSRRTGRRRRRARRRSWVLAVDDELLPYSLMRRF